MVQLRDCLPMRYAADAIAKAANITHFDVLLLDVEGSELEVLKSFDWQVGCRIRLANAIGI